ncbi:Chloride transport protein 6 [Desmophyllum pertusum]|uniref:Chloride transport protein 6 n=1 Tax=Desmophyllum pertusum TaxID=174260 RepID=A0A9W9Z5X8_9CNID|nr:Chloride transport protein 6 [Desmophyllum pertusum]
MDSTMTWRHCSSPLKNPQSGSFFTFDGAFSLTAHLGSFSSVFISWPVGRYGASVPSGLFVPCLLCGAAYGRFVGELCR